MHIPFADLRPDAQMEADLLQAAQRVLSSGHYILGKHVRQFENQFAEFCSRAHGVAVASGTDALSIALAACGVQPGDEVITVPNAGIPTLAAISQAGATPVLVDVDEYYTLDPNKIQNAITTRTKAIVPVHLYGCPAQMRAISAIAKQYGLIVVEDCAQAHGALYLGRPVGSWGHAAAFSFYPTKNLGAYGDAGMVVTNNPDIAARARQIREYGWDHHRISQRSGLNSRMDELQAALLSIKLRYLSDWNTQRCQAARHYTALLGDVVTTPSVPRGAQHVYHLYVIRHPARDEMQKYLLRYGITTKIHYSPGIRQHPAWLGVRGVFPHADQMACEVLSLPLYPGITPDMIQSVTNAIWQFGR